MFRCLRILGLLSLVSLFSFGAQSVALTKHPNAQPIDLVVYGGTASGIMTAYSAAGEGLHVVLLEPGAHLGGMVTGGLSATDLGQFNVIGGYVRDFYLRAAAHYGVHDLSRQENWYSEPHVDEDIFRKMLADAWVDVRLHERLKEHKGVQVHARRIKSITTMDGMQWIAKVFADCSYEGDLMAEAGVTYAYGRESIAQYDESLAGARPYSLAHQFIWPISAYDRHHKLLPEISPGQLAAPGTADKLVQAYTFRPILTDNPENRLLFPRPEHYDASRFALLRRYLAEFEKNRGRAPNLHDVTNSVLIPHDKADFNNNGPFSTDYIGHSWNYPNGSYAERQAIWDEHLNYIQGFFYFLSHDPSVPPSLQQEVNEWGLPRDEFMDSGHWPNQLYIRESRRMVGSYVMTQSDIQTSRTKPDAIGMGSYNIDSHNVQRVALPDGFVRNEGDMQVHVQPYEIPYRILVPRESQVQNLLVTVCVSATHVAYSSLRMEPQYMIMGEAAGVAASLSVHEGVAVQHISINAQQTELRDQKAVISLQDMRVYKESHSRPN